MSLFNRVVVIGAAGMLGRQFVAELSRRGIAHSAFGHAELDLVEEARIVDALTPLRPTLILNAAAFTKVDDCETRADYAMRVNGHAPGTLATVARQFDGMLVHISSDYVFAGDASQPYREDDPTADPAMLSAYGRGKLEGDNRILASGCRHLIARTSWVFGPGGPNFVDTIRKAAATRPELKVVNDQRGRPTFSPDLCAGIFALLDLEVDGVCNVTNSGECTWYEYACEIVRQGGYSARVQPCSSAEFVRPARRPAYSILSLDTYTRHTGQPLRHWRDALTAYMRDSTT